MVNPMTELRNLLQWSTVVLIMRLGGALLVLITQILLARWMGAYQLGIYVLAFSWLILLSTLVGLGYPMASMRVVGQALHDGRSGIIRGFLHRGRIITFVGGTLVALLGAVLLLTMPWQISPDQRQSFLIALALVPFLAAMRMHERVAHAHGWFMLAMSSNMLLRPLLFLLTVFVLYRLLGVIDAVDVMAAHALLLLLLAGIHFLIFHRRIKPQLEKATPEYQDAQWWNIAWPLLIVTMFSQYFADLDIAIVGLLVAPEQLALYNAAFRIALVITFGFLAINAVLMPRLSRLHAANDREAIQRLLRYSSAITFLGALLALAILWEWGREILGLFGEEFIAAYPVMLLLASSQLILAMLGPAAALLAVTGHQHQCLRVYMWSLLVLVAATIVLTSVAGIIGAASAVVLVNLLSGIWLRYKVGILMGVESSLLAFFFPRRVAQ